MKVKVGLKNLWIAPEKDGEPGVYDTPFREPGITALNREPNGEDSNFFADDMIYHVVSNNQGYTAEVTLANVSENFKTSILGMEKDEKTGIISESRTDSYKKFAWAYEITTDEESILVWEYGCTPSRPSNEHSTKGESADPQTDTLTVTVAGLDNAKGTVRIMTSKETSEAVRGKWFEQVIMPNEFASLGE